MAKGQMSLSEMMGLMKLYMELGRKIGGWFLRKRLADQYDPVTIEAAVEAHVQGRNIQPILDQPKRAYQARDDHQKLIQNPPKIHGAAKWAKAEDLRDAGLLKPNDVSDDDPGALYLGGLNGKSSTHQNWLHWNDEGHLLTVAPTRSGKGTMQIIPNLLRYKGSVVVLDPKGELYNATANWRRRNVGPVYRIAPFLDDTDAFNPITAIETQADARALAEMILPRTAKGDGQYFEDEAINFLSAAIYFMRHQAPVKARTMAALRECLTFPLPDFIEFVKTMALPNMPGPVRHAAAIVLGKSKDKGIPQLRESLNSKMAIWDFKGLLRSTAHNSFDFRALKDKPATVYITIPFDQLKPYSVYVQVLLSTALEAMLRNPNKPKIPVLFMLDEFLSLGPFPKFADALRTHAGAGVRLWFFLQNTSTLETHYPSDWKAFFSDTAVKMFFGSDDIYTAELLSNYLGDTTVLYTTQSQSAATVGAVTNAYTIGENITLTGRRLMMPQEIMGLLSRKERDGRRHAIHLMRGQNPAKIDLLPFYLEPKAQARHSPPIKEEKDEHHAIAKRA